jgi:hypothetical protein
MHIPFLQKPNGVDGTPFYYHMQKIQVVEKMPINLKIKKNEKNPMFDY